MHQTPDAAQPAAATAGLDSPVSAPARRLCVIFNPRAGLGRRGRFQRTLDALDHLGCDVWLHSTDGAGHGEAIARDLPDCDRVVVAGGDGTVHEVLNGLRGRDLPVAVIPLGTANVLAHELGLPRAPEALARTIAHGPVRRVHPGEVNGRLFIQMTGVGFDARVVAQVSRALKRRIGPFAFVAAFVQVTIGYGRPRYTLTCNGARATVPFIVVAKGRCYGGPFRMAPDASLREPRLHACLFESGGVFNAVRYGLSLIANRLPRQPDFRIVTGTDMSIEGPAGEPIQADGERAGELPARIRLCPETASLVVPPDPATNR